MKPKDLYAAIVVLSLLVPVTSVAVEYEIVVLDSTADWGGAFGINDSGQVVGYSRTATGESHAFLWTDGVMKDLGTLGGTNSVAFGINDSGQVVGYSITATGETHPFLWTDGVMQDLGTLGEAYFIGGLGINNPGQVIGDIHSLSGRYFCMWIPAIPETPETVLAGLETSILAEVALFGIDAEMAESLLAKVDAALAALNRGNANDAKVAMNDLKALINQVEAQVDKKITAEAAEEIIRQANAIIAVLSG